MSPALEILSRPESSNEKQSPVAHTSPLPAHTLGWTGTRSGTTLWLVRCAVRVTKPVRQLLYATVPPALALALYTTTEARLGSASLVALLLVVPPFSILVTLPIDWMDERLRRWTRDPRWLFTREGRAWLETHQASEWLGTQEGRAWLETDDGERWKKGRHDVEVASTV